MNRAEGVLREIMFAFTAQWRESELLGVFFVLTFGKLFVIT